MIKKAGWLFSTFIFVLGASLSGFGSDRPAARAAAPSGIRSTGHSPQPPVGYKSFRSEQDDYYRSLPPQELDMAKQTNSAYAQTGAASGNQVGKKNAGGADLGETAIKGAANPSSQLDQNLSAHLGAAGTTGREVFGYVPYWEGPIWDSFRWSSLTTVAWFKIVVDYKGDMVSSPSYEPPADLIAKAHANGVKVVLAVTSVDSSSVNTLIYSPTDYTKAATNIVAKVVAVGADGVNIDFEGLDAARKTDFVGFMTTLTNKMHAAKAGSKVSSTLPAIDWSGAYDTANLAAATDQLVIMGYDYFGSWSDTAGPVAPLYDPAWRSNYSLKSSLTNYLAKASPDKLILALPWYGHKWTTSTTGVPGTTITSLGSLVYSAAATEAQSYGKSWYAPSQATYTAINGSPDKQSWFDDYASLLAKYFFANDNNLAGIGVWALGYDGGRAEMWDALDSYLSPTAATLKRLPASGAGNRFDTANQISQNTYPDTDSATSVILTNAYNWPDALAGAALARKKDGPLLITDPSGLTAATATEIKRVLPAGAQVFLLGGVKALADQVATDVKNLGFKATRIAGNNRQETAKKIAESLAVSPAKILIGTKNNFADALSLSPHAGANLTPILLTDPNRLSSEIENYLDGSLGKQVKEAIIAGGETAVKKAVADRLSARGLKVTRLAGLNRYDTSAKIASFFSGGPIEICLATGLNAVDGLAGGPHAAVHGAPILLTTPSSLPGPVQTYLKNNAAPIKQGFIYGGYTVIDPHVQADTENIIKL